MKSTTAGLISVYHKENYFYTLSSGHKNLQSFHLHTDVPGHMELVYKHSISYINLSSFSRIGQDTKWIFSYS